MRNTLRTSTNLGVLLCAFTVHAQFDALPDSNATWSESFWVGPGYPWMGYYYRYAPVDPDTMLDGQVYQKVLLTTSNDGFIYGEGYAGAIHDNDSGQVYFRFPGEEESIRLYDFDVLPGDTADVHVGYWEFDGMLVTSVDTVEINGFPRKRIGVEPLNDEDGPGAYWIQGIGGTGGLLYTCGCSSVSGGWTLVCMTDDNIIQYGNGVGQTGDCSMTLGTVEASERDAVPVVAPNPVEDELVLIDVRDRVALEVIAEDGRTAIRSTTSTGRLSVAELGVGVYILRITDAGGMVRHVRFVKG